MGQLDANEVPRRVLLARLTKALTASPIVIITAGAGYGKTTVATQWARTCPDAVWIFEGNQDSHLPKSAVAIIDDAEDTSEQFIRTLAGRVQAVIVVGRPGCETPFLSELLSGTAQVFGPEDLCFSTEEVSSLCSGMGVEPEVAVSIAEATDGWPIACRAMASDSAGLRADGSTWLELYIENAFFGPRPAEEQAVMETAAGLASASATEFEELTASPTIHALLYEWSKTGVLQHLPGPEEDRYRWSPAMRTALLDRLRRRDPTTAKNLAHRVADLFGARRSADALEVAMRMGERTLAFDLLCRYWLRLLFQSRTDVVESACIDLGGDENVNLLLIRACCREVLLDPVSARTLRARAIAQNTDRDSSVGLWADLFLEPAGVAKGHALKAVLDSLASPSQCPDYLAALTLAAWAQVRLRTDMAAAITLASSACSQAKSYGEEKLLQVALPSLAAAFAFRGDLNQAEATLAQCRDEHGDHDWRIFEGGIIEFLRAYLDFCRGDLASAQIGFRSVALLSGYSAYSYSALGRVYFAITVALLGQTAFYSDALRGLDTVAFEELHSISWRTQRNVAAAHLAWALGNHQGASQLLLAVLDVPSAPQMIGLSAQLFRRLGDHKNAMRAVQVVQTNDCPRLTRITHMVTSAVIRRQNGDKEGALQQMDSALSLATESRILLPFLTDPTMIDLVNEVASNSRMHDEIIALILLRSQNNTETFSLTARELELMGYLRTPMSNQEISDVLGVTLPTVKSHIQSIYKKLGVGSRKEAVRITAVQERNRNARSTFHPGP